MAKQITIKYEGTDYTLEYTRKSIQKMEAQGFNIGGISDTPMTTLPKLFAGAFLAHHQFVRQETIDAIYALLPDKEGLIGKLSEMYSEPLQALLAEPKEGNLKWEANW